MSGPDLDPSRLRGARGRARARVGRSAGRGIPRAARKGLSARAPPRASPRGGHLDAGRLRPSGERRRGGRRSPPHHRRDEGRLGPGSDPRRPQGAGCPPRRARRLPRGRSERPRGAALPPRPLRPRSRHRGTAQRRVRKRIGGLAGVGFGALAGFPRGAPERRRSRPRRRGPDREGRVGPGEPLRRLRPPRESPCASAGAARPRTTVPACHCECEAA